MTTPPQNHVQSQSKVVYIPWRELNPSSQIEPFREEALNQCWTATLVLRITQNPNQLKQTSIVLLPLHKSTKHLNSNNNKSNLLLHREKFLKSPKLINLQAKKIILSEKKVSSKSLRKLLFHYWLNQIKKWK